MKKLFLVHADYEIPIMAEDERDAEIQADAAISDVSPVSMNVREVKRDDKYFYQSTREARPFNSDDDKTVGDILDDMKADWKPDHPSQQVLFPGVKLRK